MRLSETLASLAARLESGETGNKIDTDIHRALFGREPARVARPYSTAIGFHDSGMLAPVKIMSMNWRGDFCYAWVNFHRGGASAPTEPAARLAAKLKELVHHFATQERAAEADAGAPNA